MTLFFQLLTIIQVMGFFLILLKSRPSSFVRIILSVLVFIAYSTYVIVFFHQGLLPPDIIFWSIPVILFDDKWYFSFAWCLISNLFFTTGLTTWRIFTSICLDISYDVLHEHRFFPNIIVTVIGIIILFIINKSFPEISTQIRKLTWKGYLLIIPACILIYLLVISSGLPLVFKRLNNFGRIFLSISMLTVAILYMVILIFYFQLRARNSELREREQLQRELLTLEQRTYLEIQKKNEDLRAFKHDFSHHLLAISTLAQKGNTQILLNYISTLTDIQSTISVIYVGHPVADAIINYYNEHKQDDISFFVSGKIPPSQPLSDDEITIVFSNLIKNSFEAAEKVNNNSDKQVNLIIDSNDDSLIIQTRNTSHPYTSHQLKHLYSEKPDTINHGFGLKNIKKIVDIYGGACDYRYEDGCFITTLYIPNNVYLK